MSYKHIILTIDHAQNEFAHEFMDILRERGQECVVDIRKCGINGKMRDIDENKYDFIHVLNALNVEIKYTDIRDNRKRGGIKHIGSMKCTDFMHNIWCGNI